jgi:hypothetical protein
MSRVTKRRRSDPTRINIPALNNVRREYLLGLARNYEAEVEGYKRLIADHSLNGQPKRGYARDFGYWRRRRNDCLRIAAIYRDMAAYAFKADDPRAISERDKLAAKLRAMTVANGCTEAEADTAQMMLFRLEAEEAIPCA